MIITIFNAMYAALYGNLYVAVLAAFVWGLASVLLSPCHLSGIPLMVGFMTGKRVLTANKAFKLSLLFSVGILLSITVIGLITALLGRMIGDLGSHANLIFGIAVIIGGILLMDILPSGSVSFLSKIKVDGTKSIHVLCVGFLFGLALGPCAFAFMAPVLTLVFNLAETKLVMALIIMSAYAIGHCAVIVLAGTSVSWVQKLLNWNDKSKNLLFFKRVCAALVVAGGIYLIMK